MSWFLIHLTFSFLWAALLGSYDFLTLLSGFVIGFALFALTLREQTELYRYRVLAVIRFIGFYLGEILKSNLRIAFDVVRVKPQTKPGIVAIKIDGLDPRSAVLVANLITMTPGTLSLDISDDGNFIYVHCLYLQDPEETRRSIEKDYVDRITSLQKPLVENT